MTKQEFTNKWIGWVSYINREKPTKEMEFDLEAVHEALQIQDICVNLDQDNKTSSATKCNCGREKWEHQ